MNLSPGLTVAIILLLIFTGHGINAKRRPNPVPIELNQDNWTNVLKGEWMVNFHAHWCPACQALKPEWEQLADWSDDLNIKVGWSDITQNPGLSGRFLISGLPTIYHVKEGIFRIYTGPRNYKSMIDFVEEKKWQQVVPISSWLQPESIQMSFVSTSFQLSMKLRDTHNYLVDDIGIPSYLSYSMFAICTILFGTILGLIIVSLVDLMYPVKVKLDDSNSFDGNEQSQDVNSQPDHRSSGYNLIDDLEKDVKLIRRKQKVQDLNNDE